ncbi:MAG: helix-turn-helix transcriptional regulator [Sulfurovum sp.]
MHISIITAVLIIGLFQIAFILHALSRSILALHRRWELKLFFILLALSFVDSIFIEESIYFTFPILFKLLTPICLFLGPLFYIYILQNTYPTVVSSFTNIKRHFILPAILLLLYFPFYIFYSDSEKISILTSGEYQDLYLYSIFKISGFIDIIINLFYLILSLRRITLHQKYIKENFSDVTNYSFEWIKKMLLGLIFLIIVCTLNIFCDNGYINELIMVVWILVFNWQLLIHIDNNIHILNNPISINKPSLISSTEELKIISIELEELMKERELYLNLTLSLDDIAKEMSISRQKISEVLNQYMKISFYDYINQKRVSKAKELLLDKKYEGNILMLSLDCGFKSRSVFYTAFKKNTQLTPSEYKKNYL